ncbi:MAG: hypothetical protein VB046_09775 [Paludibacter sp.]|nr:hypothetical protein [Paludibacter sp.]
MAKKTFEEIKPWDGTSGTGSEARLVIKENFDKVNDMIDDLPTEYVSVSDQELTSEQKEKARENIGAFASEDVVGEFGANTTKVIDQKTVSDKFVKNDLFNKINTEIAYYSNTGTRVLQNGATESGTSLVIPVGSTGNSSYNSLRFAQSFLDDNNGKTITLKCVVEIQNYIANFTSKIKNGATWADLASATLKNIQGNLYLLEFTYTVNSAITNQQLVIQKGATIVASELVLKLPKIYLVSESDTQQKEQVLKLIDEVNSQEIVPDLENLKTYIQKKYVYAGGFNVRTTSDYYLGGKKVATTIGYVNDEDYFLKEIECNVTGTGTLHLAIGYLDQRNLAILSDEFTVEVVTGYNKIDVTSIRKIIPAGSYLFAHARYGGAVEDTLEVRWYKHDIGSASPYQFYYGNIGGIFGTPNPVTYPDGGYLQLKWSGDVVESIFAKEQDVIEASENATAALNVATDAKNGLGIVYDRTGNAYDMLVVDGSLQLITKQYSKVLVLGNSISLNGRVYAYGWCGARGMASSIASNDFIHKLETGLKTKNAGATVSICNLWEWEANYTTLHSLSYYLDNALAQQPDCIVVRLGENVQDATQLQTKLTELINYCLDYLSALDPAVYPALYITSMAMSDTVAKNNAFIAVANTFRCPYINVSVSAAEYKEKAGNYLWGDETLDGGSTWNTAVQVLYKITSQIATHPNDIGMLIIANQILSAMNYNQIDALRSISLTNNTEAAVICPENWVVGGRCNIQVDNYALIASITVTDSEENPISITDHEDGVFSFDMPDLDLIIEIN